MSLQDPEFDTFKHAFKAENFDAALHSIKKLYAQYPQSFALRWHHAKVLQELKRFAEARTILNNVMELRSNFIPALIMQVQLDFHENENSIEAIENDVFANDPAQKPQSRFDAIEDRLYKILSLDPNAVDALYMLSGLLRGHEGDTHVAKADQLLERAIYLAPDRVDLLEDRANSFLAQTTDYKNDNTHHMQEVNSVTTSSGTCYLRHVLEQALADFEKCYALSRQHRYGLRVGSILHDLQRFTEALAIYDNILAHVLENDPYRSFIVERRARSENSRLNNNNLTHATIQANNHDVDSITAPEMKQSLSDYYNDFAQKIRAKVKRLTGDS